MKLDHSNAAAVLRLGALAITERDFETADSRISEAQRRYDEMGNVEAVTESMILRGYLLNSMDQTERAQAFLRQALDRATIYNSPSQQVTILLQLSNIACTGGKVTEAESLAQQAIELAQKETMQSTATDGLIALGNSFLSRRDFSAAEKFFDQASDFARSYKGLRGENSARLSIASLNVERGKAKEAIGEIEQALAFFKAGYFERESVQALTLLARARRKLGEYDTAIGIYQEALGLLAAKGDRSELTASCHSGIATLLSYREEYTDALGHYRESFELSERLGLTLAAGYDAMNKARMLAQLGRYDEAEGAFARASELSQQTPQDKSLRGWIAVHSAKMESSRMHFAEAESKARIASDLAGSRSREIAIQARLVIGQAMALSARRNAGLKSCRDAVDAARALDDPRHLSESLVALARVLLDSGNISGASAAAKEAADLCAKLGKRDSQWRAMLLLSLCADYDGDRGTARAQAARAKETLTAYASRLAPEVFTTYLRRPDVAVDYKRLGKLLGAN